jgi:hypothetical protein
VDPQQVIDKTKTVIDLMKDALPLMAYLHLQTWGQGTSAAPGCGTRPKKPLKKAAATLEKSLIDAPFFASQPSEY